MVRKIVTRLGERVSFPYFSLVLSYYCFYFFFNFLKQACSINVGFMISIFLRGRDRKKHFGNDYFFFLPSWGRLPFLFILPEHFQSNTSSFDKRQSALTAPLLHGNPQHAKGAISLHLTFSILSNPCFEQHRLSLSLRPFTGLGFPQGRDGTLEPNNLWGI